MHTPKPSRGLLGSFSTNCVMRLWLVSLLECPRFSKHTHLLRPNSRICFLCQALFTDSASRVLPSYKVQFLFSELFFQHLASCGLLLLMPLFPPKSFLSPQVAHELLRGRTEASSFLFPAWHSEFLYLHSNGWHHLLTKCPKYTLERSAVNRLLQRHEKFAHAGHLRAL